MGVVQLELDDRLVQTVGMEAIKAFVGQQLSLLRMRYLGEKISHAIDQAGFDHEGEVERARQEAWEENKAKYLKQI